MSTLRQRMNDAMVLRGLAERTKESYLYWVSGLAKFHGRSPDALDTAAIQAYLLHLITEKKLAYASVNQAACAIRFLFAAVLGERNIAYDIPMARTPKRLPQILTRDEVSRLFAHSRTLRARTLLMTTYAAGLRLSEVSTLQLTDIESAPDRMCIKVRQGKGGKDRYTLLSPRLLEALRLHWRIARPRHWLFPASSGDGTVCEKTVLGVPAQLCRDPQVHSVTRVLSERQRNSLSVRTTPCAKPDWIDRDAMAALAFASEIQSARRISANPR